jgi:predicted nucleic acid-binding protein
LIVLDTSAAITCVTGVEVDRALLQRLADAGSLYAPHLIDAEVLAALGGLVLGKKLTEDRATYARRDFADRSLVRYPMVGLADRVWSLRHTMTTYDGCVVALAEALGCPLVTCDARMAGASRSRHRATGAKLIPMDLSAELALRQEIFDALAPAVASRRQAFRKAG